MTPNELYTKYCRPALGELLSLVRLDKHYERGTGDELFFTDDAGAERKVLDFLGGYGAGILGHHHPRISGVAVEMLQKGVVFNGQASTRRWAGEAAHKLSALLEARTGTPYVITFASTGAEAVEAAVKHAVLERRKGVNKTRAMLADAAHAIRKKIFDGPSPACDSLYREVEELTGTPCADFEGAVCALDLYNARLLDISPVFAALEKSFHGKTGTAVQLTDNDEYRLPFRGIAASGCFLNFATEEDLAQIAEDQWLTVATLERVGDSYAVAQKRLSNLCGIFVEPIQGEGGVRPISAAVMTACRNIADATGAALIVDEIQTGMGRTGRFLASEHTGTKGDYYLFSKSLGGGLTKVSAMAVPRKRYVADFSMIHTSTFAEDDFSARIACEVLDIVGDDSFLAETRTRGDAIMAGLEDIARRHPGAFAQVRGRGLLIGVELADMSRSPSACLHMLGQHNMLGYVAAGYLLSVHGIRVAPTLSSQATIRIQPSAYVTDEGIRALLAAMERLASVLSRQDAGELVSFLAERQIDLSEPARDFSRPQVDIPDVEGLPRVAFLGHFISAGDLRKWDPSFEVLTLSEIETLVEKLYATADPYVYVPKIVESKTGEKVALYFIGLFLTSSVIHRHMMNRDLGPMRGIVARAVDVARELGCQTAGLGGFTSIVTRNCQSLPVGDIGLTSGNAFTVAMGLEAIFDAAKSQGLNLSKTTAAIIGAAGNIGQTNSKILAVKVPQLILIGTARTQAELEHIAEDIYAYAAKRALFSKETRLEGVAAVLRDMKGLEDLRDEASHPSFGRAIRRLAEAHSRLEPPIRVTTDIEELKKANVVLTATNQKDPIIFPELLSEGPVVINDISVPADVHRSVLEQRSDVTVIQGGLVRLPRNPELCVAGIPLEPGVLFACLSETLLLGLEKRRGHYSYGPINESQVYEIAGIAKKHGFALARAKTERSF